MSQQRTRASYDNLFLQSYFHGRLRSELAVFFHMNFLPSVDDKDIGK